MLQKMPTSPTQIPSRNGQFPLSRPRLSRAPRAMSAAAPPTPELRRSGRAAPGVPARFRDGADLTSLSPPRVRRAPHATAATAAHSPSPGAPGAAGRAGAGPRRARVKHEPGPVGRGVDGEPLYDIEVLELGQHEGQERALVHYVGWDDEYDEWLPLNYLTEAVRGRERGVSRAGLTVALLSPCHQALREVLRLKALRAEKDGAIDRVEGIGPINFNLEESTDPPTAAAAEGRFTGLPVLAATASAENIQQCLEQGT